MAVISYPQLREAVAGGAVGIRARIPLEPLGGADDKLFPPTYAADGAPTRYALEKRRVNGETVDAVVLDSVASQANRFEIALLDAVRRGELSLPLVSVDFRRVTDLADLDRLSALEASHRIFDAALRDSLLGDTLFRLSHVGRQITESSPRNAASLFHYSPTTLLFGGWDSTGPRGGLGAKYERAITSEIVALGIERGTKTASRIDPLAIQMKAAIIYESADTDEMWTPYPDRAVVEKGQPKRYQRKEDDQPGRPSQVNLGNVTPTIDATAGGVTADSVHALVVLSFAALRKLRFPVDLSGAVIEDDRRRDAEVAAWTALAALGLAATVLAVEEGFDLRSRCVLRPTAPLAFELLQRDGSAAADLTLDREGSIALLASSVAAAGELGLTWRVEELLLTPSERLAHVVRRSRALLEDQPTEAS